MIQTKMLTTLQQFQVCQKTVHPPLTLHQQSDACTFSIGWQSEAETLKRHTAQSDLLQTQFLWLHKKLSVIITDQ